jgi:hypothetical protein
MNRRSNLIYFDGNSNFARLSEGFEKRIETALALLQPYAQPLLDIVPSKITYFKINEDESGEYDCCYDDKCIRRAKKLIRSQYDKKPKIVRIWTYNNGDHERIDHCRICGVPLNTQLTWVESELEGVEDLSTKDEIVSDAFAIYCVLDALPSNDEEIRHWSKMSNERLEEAVERAEKFYLRLSKLTDRVIFCFHCGASQKLSLPMRMSEAADAMIAFAKSHASCEKTWTEPTNDGPESKSIEENERWWLMHGEHGLSSKAMFNFFTISNQAVLSDYSAHPRDPSDFRRCYLLLKAVPQYKERLERLKILSPVWSNLVDNWEKLTELLEEQMQTKKDNGLYDLMKSLGC